MNLQSKQTQTRDKLGKKSAVFELEVGFCTLGFISALKCLALMPFIFFTNMLGFLQKSHENAQLMLIHRGFKIFKILTFQDKTVQNA